jgi:hypothetical protein
MFINIEELHSVVYYSAQKRGYWVLGFVYRFVFRVEDSVFVNWIFSCPQLKMKGDTYAKSI